MGERFTHILTLGLPEFFYSHGLPRGGVTPPPPWNFLVITAGVPLYFVGVRYMHTLQECNNESWFPLLLGPGWSNVIFTVSEIAANPAI